MWPISNVLDVVLSQIKMNPNVHLAEIIIQAIKSLPSQSLFLVSEKERSLFQKFGRNVQAKYPNVKTASLLGEAVFLFYFFHYFFEDFRIILAKLRQYLSIKFDFIFSQAKSEFAVIKPLFPASGIDLDLPESSSFSFLCFPIPVSVFPGMTQGVFSRPELIFSAPTKTFSLF